MSDLMKIDEDQIREAIAEKYHVSEQGVVLGNDYEFVRRGDDKVRRDFVYAIVDNRAAKPITNAERIRAMTDEELAEHLFDVANYACPPGKEFTTVVCSKYPDCKKCWLDWLKQEAQ